MLPKASCQSHRSQGKETLLLRYCTPHYQQPISPKARVRSVPGSYCFDIGTREHEPSTGSSQARSLCAHDIACTSSVRTRSQPLRCAALTRGYLAGVAPAPPIRRLLVTPFAAPNGERGSWSSLFAARGDRASLAVGGWILLF